MAAHHTLEAYLDECFRVEGIERDKKGPLFRKAPGTQDELTRKPMRTADVWRMIRCRAVLAGIRSSVGCHSFRATGITWYLE